MKSTRNRDRPFGILLMNVLVCPGCTFRRSDSLGCLPKGRFWGLVGHFHGVFLGPMGKRCEPMLKQEHVRNIWAHLEKMCMA